jgi:hypothetical protein
MSTDSEIDLAIAIAPRGFLSAGEGREGSEMAEMAGQ